MVESDAAGPAPPTSAALEEHQPPSSEAVAGGANGEGLPSAAPPSSGANPVLGEDDSTTRILKRGDLVRVLERRGARVKERPEGLGRIHRSIPIPPEELAESSSGGPSHPFRYDVDWVLGGRVFNVPRSELVHTTATAEGLTEAPRRKRKPSSIVVEAEAAAKTRKTAATKVKKKASAGKTGSRSSAAAKKKSLNAAGSKSGGKGGGASNAKRGRKGGAKAPSPVPEDHSALQSNALDMYERHRREFERLLGRLERIDPFGFFLGQPPTEFDEKYVDGDEQEQNQTGNGTEQDDAEIEAESEKLSAAEKGSIGPALSAGSTNPEKDVESEVTFPSRPPFNWSVVRKRMEHGRYLLDREKQEEEKRKQLLAAYKAWKFDSGSTTRRIEIDRPNSLVLSDSPRTAGKKDNEKKPADIGAGRRKLLHSKGIDWDTFRRDVVGMCDAAIARDPEGTTGGSGTLGHAASKIRETMEQMYARTGQRQMAEMNLANMKRKFESIIKVTENHEAAMQCAWRKHPFPERRYERLAKSNVVCAGLSTLDERSAVYELKTSLPDSFVGLSYTYDDMGQSEGWMKSVVDEADNSRKRGRKKKDDAEEERRAAMALAADDGVVRAQVRTTMDILLIGVQDKVMTDFGVLQHPEVRSANWDDGDVGRASGDVSDTAVRSDIASSKSTAEVAEQPVWGIDCYTRKNIAICLETDFESDVALEFIEKWLLPAINSCPVDVAHDMACAARVLEGLPPVAASPTTEGESTEEAENTAMVASRASGDHVFLSEALADKIKTCGPPWLKEAAYRLRMAVESLGSDIFRIHPKGHGSVVLRKEGLPANTLVTHYRGEVYPPWRWGEKLDAIEQTQKRIGLRPNLPDFYNMALERPRVDPRGFGLLFVDASRKAGLGSSFSHSCDPTCEVKVVAVNGQLSLAMTTLRDLERGEELTFDYHAVTESVNEYHFAICLCGHSKCRGSFLHFATADCYQQVLSRNAPIAVQFSNLAKGCMKKVLSKEDGRVLENHGFGTAAFGAVSFNHHRGGDEPLDSMDYIPIWLRTFVADTLRYIEYERRALPIALLSNHFTQENDQQQQSQAGSTMSPNEANKDSSTKSKKPVKSASSTGKKGKKAASKTTSKESETASEEPKIPLKDSKPIPGSKPEPVFLYFSKKQKSSFLKILQEQGMDDLTGLALNSAVQKLAGATWKSLSDDMKQYWRDRVIAEWEMNGGREKAKLEDERKLRVLEFNAGSKQACKEPQQKQDGKENGKKRKLEEATSRSNGKNQVGEKKKKPKKVAETIETNKISFQAADAEGWAAMEQRIHQLTQTLSRVGRVLDRHREAAFVSCALSRSTATADFLRDKIHSPLAMLSDAHVVGWLWNHPDGITQTLLRAVKEKPWSKSPLRRGVKDILKRHELLSGFPYLSCDGSIVSPLSEYSGPMLPPSRARRLVITALLQLRDEVLRSIRVMEADVQQYEKQQYEMKAKAKREALRKRRAARKKAKEAEAKEALGANAAGGAVDGKEDDVTLGASAGTSRESGGNSAVIPFSEEQVIANVDVAELSDRAHKPKSDSPMNRPPAHLEAASVTSKTLPPPTSVGQMSEGDDGRHQETASVSLLSTQANPEQDDVGTATLSKVGHEAKAALAPLPETSASFPAVNDSKDEGGVGAPDFTDAKDASLVNAPKSAKKKGRDSCSPKAGTKVFKVCPWKRQLQHKYKLESAADLLLIYAHTSTFFSLKPYRNVESTPIEVYARELGNSVPRSLVETAEANGNKSSTDAENEPGDNSERSDAGGVKSPLTDGPIILASSNVGLDSKDKSSKRKSASSKEEEEEGTVEICEPDEIITSVNVSYPGHYVLACLLQWYTGGISLKPDLPDMNGCIMLPPLSSCWADKVWEDQADSDRTVYDSEVRQKLLDWFEDRHARGSPWPEDIVRYFPSSNAGSVLVMGSPVLDLLITGNDENIYNVIDGLRFSNADEASSEPETSDGTKRKPVKKSAAERLQSTVDEGMPAQAVANWVQCENPKCMKWRKLPWHVDVDLLPEKFFCKDNVWNPGSDSCASPEDDWDMNDTPVKFNEIPLDRFVHGARFDVLRKGKKEYSEGVVVKVDFESDPKRVQFHFPRMSVKWDEWVEADSTRIAPHQAYTRASTKYKSAKNGAKDSKQLTEGAKKAPNEPLEATKDVKKTVTKSKPNPVAGGGAKLQGGHTKIAKNIPLAHDASRVKKDNKSNPNPAVQRKPKVVQAQAHRSVQTNVTVPSFSQLQSQEGKRQLAAHSAIAHSSYALSANAQLQSQEGKRQLAHSRTALSSYALAGNALLRSQEDRTQLAHSSTALPSYALAGNGEFSHMPEASTFYMPRDATDSTASSIAPAFAPSPLQSQLYPTLADPRSAPFPGSAHHYGFNPVAERNYNAAPRYDVPSAHLIGRGSHDVYPGFPRAHSTQDHRNNESHLPSSSGYGSLPWPPPYPGQDPRNTRR